MTFAVTLDSDVDAPVTVDFATTDNTALAGADFVANSGTLTFAGMANEVQNVTVILIDDPAPEADETFFVDLNNLGSAGRSGSIAPTRGTGTILDNDGLTFAITATDAAALEPVSGLATDTGTFRVSHNDPSSVVDVTVPLDRAASTAGRGDTPPTVPPSPAIPEAS